MRRTSSRRMTDDCLHGGHDPLRKVDLELDGVSVCDPTLELGPDGSENFWRLMSEDVRSVREHVIDEVVAVGIDDMRALPAHDVWRHPGHRTVRTDGAVDPAREHTLRALTQRAGVAVIHGARSALAR